MLNDRFIESSGMGILPRMSTAGITAFLFIISVNISGYSNISMAAIALATMIGIAGLLSRLHVHPVALIPIPFLCYWISSGLIAGAGPSSASNIVNWLNQDGRLLVALLPLVVIGVLRPTHADQSAVVWLLRTFAWFNLFLYLAAIAGAPGTQLVVRGGTYFGLTSSHHAPGFIFGATLLIILFRATRHGWSPSVVATITACATLVLVSGSRSSIVGLLLAFVWFAITQKRIAILIRTTFGLMTATVVAGIAGGRLADTGKELLSSNFQYMAISAFQRGWGQTELGAYISIEGRLPGYLANIASRFWLWGSGLGMWKQSPLIGIGSGRANDHDLHYSGIGGFASIATGGISPPDSATGVHNQFLQTLVENGIVGLALLIALWVGLYRCARRSQTEGWQSTSARLLIPFAFGTALFGNTLESPALTFVILSWFAIVVVGNTPDLERAHRLPTDHSGSPEENGDQRVRWL